MARRIVRDGQPGPPLTDEQAHDLGASVRAGEFVHAAVDWTAVTGITEPLLAMTDIPRSAKPRAAAAAVALIRRDASGVSWRGQGVNIETLAAIFDVLSDGQHRGGCPGSDGGYHEWAAAEVNPTGTTPVRIPLKNRRCQRCGLQG
jgi:hypothetical protein